VLLVGFRSYFKANMMELGLLGVKYLNQYGICGLESSSQLKCLHINSLCECDKLLLYYLMCLLFS